MSRKRTFDVNRFDGGITNDLRSNDTTKCAFVSHFDIYRDPNKLYPMPGYVNDSGVKYGTGIAYDDDPDDPNGMKQYDCQALFVYTQSNGINTHGILAVGKRADGTGWKLISKTNPEATCWQPDNVYGFNRAVEGSSTLVDNTFLTSNDPGSPFDTLFLTYGATTIDISSHDGSFVFTQQEASAYPSASYTFENRAIVEVAPDGQVYSQRVPGLQDVWLLDASPAEAKSTNLYPYDLQAGNEVLGIIGQQNNNDLESRLLLWDTASVLVDQNILLGKGTGRALGYIDGTWVTVTEEAFSRTPYAGAGLPSMHVQYVIGGIPYSLARVYGKTTTNGKIQPLRSYYRNSFLFEGVIPTNSEGTEFKRGIWAVGRATAQSPLALSLLWDTTDLGDIQDFKTYGNYGLFVHGGDGSISRTDNLTTGTFDQTAVYESLFFGADTPYTKTLNGLSVHTEELPSGATVVAKYRFDDDDSWTTMGTASTEGDQIHHFTNASGSQIGTFKEIQLRIEVTGNAPIKNIHVSLEEQDSTPYDA